jgi:biotin synthase
MAQRVLLRASGLRASPVRAHCFFIRPFSTVLDTPVDPGTQQLRTVKRQTSVFENALNAKAPRTDWTKDEIAEIYNTSLIDLTYASVGWPDLVPPPQHAPLMISLTGLGPSPVP